MHRIMPLLAASIGLLAAPAHGVVKDKSPAGFTVVNSVVVPVEPKVAWQGLVQHVDQWWPKDHSWWGKDGTFKIDAKAGGCFCELAGDRQAQHMVVSFVDPPHTLRMLGGLGPLQGMGLHGALEWMFAPTEGGTKITLRYVAGGYTTADLVKFSAIVDEVQGMQLGGLATFLGKK